MIDKVTLIVYYYKNKGEEVMKDVEVDVIFKERIVESNIFSKREQEKIKEDYLLCKKCYYLGILDNLRDV